MAAPPHVLQIHMCVDASDAQAQHVARLLIGVRPLLVDGRAHLNLRHASGLSAQARTRGGMWGRTLMGSLPSFTRGFTSIDLPTANATPPVIALVSGRMGAASMDSVGCVTTGGVGG